MTYYEQLCKKPTLKAAWKKLHKRPQSVGLDKVTIQEFRTNLDENLEVLSQSLAAGDYKPIKLLPAMLKKPEGGYRILRIPAVRDRVVQRAILDLITPKLNERYNINGNGVSYAYVNGGGVSKAAEEIVSAWANGYTHVYKADIIKFFDNINREQLLGMISDALGDDQSIKEIIKMHLNCEIENFQKIAEYDPTIYSPSPLIGLAQGSPLSPVFANVYLANFDMAMIDKGLKTIRYADDLVVMARSISDAKAAHKFVKDELAKLSLKIHPLKSEGELHKKGHAKPKYSEARRCQDLIFLGLTFKSKKVYPAGRSYQNAHKSVRFAAYDTSTTFVQKLVSIDARVFGWAAAYYFTEREPGQISKLDAELDRVLSIMLRKQGLKLKQKVAPHTALGIPNYSSAFQKIENNKNKEASKSSQAKAN